jgi:hypothetical protein
MPLLQGPPGHNEMPGHLGGVSPGEQGVEGELRSMLADDHFGLPRRVVIQPRSQAEPVDF